MQKMLLTLHIRDVSCSLLMKSEDFLQFFIQSSRNSYTCVITINVFRFLCCCVLSAEQFDILQVQIPSIFDNGELLNSSGSKIA